MINFRRVSKPSVIISIVAILCVIVVGAIAVNRASEEEGADALSYQAEIGVGFTFKPTISVSLSTDSLIIPNLAPGTTGQSNAVIVSVSTNAAYGYTLFADVGDADVQSIYYDTSDLVYEDGGEGPVFGSIAMDAQLSDLEVDNTWGYSTSNDAGSTWSAYSGLSFGTGKVLLDTDETAATSNIDFKVAARASTNQSSGSYGNVINFYAVGKPQPMVINDLTYLQEFGTIAATDLETVKKSMITNTVYHLKDIRDDRDYTIAKLDDGRIWMTQNLDLPGETALYSDTSDVPEGYSSAEGVPYFTLPESSEEGFDDLYVPFVYNVPFDDNDRTSCSTFSPCYSYYSWVAATAGAQTSASTGVGDAPYSICPKGWHLPNTREGTDNTTDFRSLAIGLGGSANIDIYDSTTNPTGASLYSSLVAFPNDFKRGGHFQNSIYGWNGKGYYWSSTAIREGSAYGFAFNESTVNTRGDDFTRAGMSVRCVAN